MTPAEHDELDQKLWWTTVRPWLANITSWPHQPNLGVECPTCGDTYHDLPKHLKLNYKNCAPIKSD